LKNIPAAGTAAFSFSVGGRLDELLAIAGLAGDARGRRMRYTALLAIAWLPVVVLAAAGGVAWGGVAYPLLVDPGPWVRFFIVAPLLIFAEPVTDRVLGGVIDQFRSTGLVADQDAPAFEAIVTRAQRLATSDTIGLILATIALALPHVIASAATEVVAGHGTWMFRVSGAGSIRSAAGHWYEWVSLPLVEFLLLRWVWRGLAWWRLLWGISRLSLRIMPTHPDRAGGLSFLALAPSAFLPVFAGVSALASLGISVQLRFGGQHLADVRGSIVGFVVLELILLLVPQFLFAPSQGQARRRALRSLGAAGAGAARAFERHWAGDAPGEAGELLESNHPGAMADFASTYELARTMRPAGLSMQELIGVVLPLVAPFVPLLLFQYSPAQIVQRLMEMVH
jgi:hypothetical protein